jgi:hypothetical protein
MTGGAFIKAIEVDKNGHPYAVLREPTTPKKIVTNICAALSAPYEPKCNLDGEILPEELKYVGMSKSEVGIDKLANGFAAGEIDATKLLLDRVIGKPKQQIESIQVQIGINEYLTALAEQEKNSQPDAEVLITEVDKYSSLAGI